MLGDQLLRGDAGDDFADEVQRGGFGPGEADAGFAHVEAFAALLVGVHEPLGQLGVGVKTVQVDGDMAFLGGQGSHPEAWPL